MAGGLFNIVSLSANNLIIHGNPQKTFFKCSYAKITNFGLQKFRLDYEGSRDLRIAESSTFSFTVKRYADLLMDSYVCVNLPNIWSPIYHPVQENNYSWSGYDFRWIENIGTQIISSIEIRCGASLLQKYSGAYLQSMLERDFSSEKKDMFNRMSGHVSELNEPETSFGRINTYPSCYYSTLIGGAEPSIRARTIYIPINSWFTMNSRTAFPLVSLQYNELVITVTMRPIQDLFQVRDVFDYENQFPYIRPDFNQERFQMYRFLQTPPSVRITAEAYQNKNRTWNADIHMLSTYCFLSKDEQETFAAGDQMYLVKDVFEYKYENVTGSSRVKLTSAGMVSSWMWFFQRNDVYMRNEWSNYTNWPYKNLPVNLIPAPFEISADINDGITDSKMILNAGPGSNLNGTNTGLFITGDFSPANTVSILETLGIVFDGDYRENVMTRGIYDYIEKYARTNGSAKNGLYCYNFCVNTDPHDYQPSGAINMSRFKTIELEFTTYIPEIDLIGATFNVVCDTTGLPVGVTNKPAYSLYQYNYDLTVFEERYNIISIIGGNCGMLYAR